MDDQYAYYEETESENNVKCDLEICICSKASSIAFALAEIWESSRKYVLL